MINHTFVTARFLDGGHSTAEALWQDNEKNVTHADLIVRDSDSTAWKNLLEHITLEQILRNTFDYNEAKEKELREFVKKIYPPEVITEVHERVVELEKRWFDFEKFLNGELSEEDLFRLKILIFETEVVKRHKDRSLKTKIRKSKDPIEVISLYYNAIQTSS